MGLQQIGGDAANRSEIQAALRGLDAIEDGCDEVRDGGFVVGGGVVAHTVSDD
jgi:hypothetical protein